MKEKYFYDNWRNKIKKISFFFFIIIMENALKSSLKFYRNLPNTYLHNAVVYSRFVSLAAF